MTAPPAISEWVTGPRVKWAQYLLVCRAPSCNQIDGIFGPVTKTAVGEYQRDSHLPADGVAGPADWAALGGDGMQPPALARGSHGLVVEKLQTALNEGWGDFAPEPTPVLAVDGVYGEQGAAVKGTRHWPVSTRMAWSASEPGTTLARGQPGARRPVRCPEPGSRIRPGVAPATGSFAARPSRDVINLRSVPRTITSGSPRAMHLFTWRILNRIW